MIPIYYLTVSMGQEFRDTQLPGLGAGSHKAAIQVSAGLQADQMLHWGTICFRAPLGCRQDSFYSYRSEVPIFLLSLRTQRPPTAPGHMALSTVSSHKIFCFFNWQGSLSLLSACRASYIKKHNPGSDSLYNWLAVWS